MQLRQVNPSSSVNVLPFSDEHVGGRSQEAYGRSEGERVHQPQLNGEVVGATLGWETPASVDN